MQSVFYTYAQLGLDSTAFKQRLLAWANDFPIVAYYEHNQIPYPYQGFDNLLAVTRVTQRVIDPENAFPSLLKNLEQTQTWWCGFLGYDLKNQIEKLSSQNPDNLELPEIYFFVPEIILSIKLTGFDIISTEIEIPDILAAIINATVPADTPMKQVVINQRTSREHYINTVRAIQENILAGNVYELNYCVEFYAPEALIDPLITFQKLNQASPTPFAGYFKYFNQFLLCASPERFLKKEGPKLISQPIKGTIRRGANPPEDEKLREQLRTSEKEISENMMIMDLVRNDLARSAMVGSVKVEEMFGIYGFRHLYQMITTVTASIRPDCAIPEAIKNAFPMGSMTGAPKIRAMELIEQYETTRRGLFSGSLGYIKPNGDFDFNVIIRSLQYNATTKYLSYMVGSAITYDSDPEQEYEECLLKAKAITDILKSPPG